MVQDRIFTSALIISIFIHGLVLWFMPGLNLMDKIKSMEWLEVELILPSEIEPQISSGSSSLPGETEESSVSETDGSELFPSPPVWVPERMNPLKSESIAMKLVIPSDLLHDLAGPGLTAPTDLLASETDKTGSGISDAGEAPPELLWNPSQSVLSTPETNARTNWQISGEVAQRKVTYRPAAPRTTTMMNGTVHIKFWVDPDGTISKMVPIMRSNSDLERIAMDYLQKWRFEAVDSSVGRQNGTIPIRFMIK